MGVCTTRLTTSMPKDVCGHPVSKEMAYRMCSVEELIGFRVKTADFSLFPFSTNGNDECVYAKSICSLEGQVVFHDLESDIDRSCKCDYTYGYAFILEPAKKCKCDPFIEDCTCYKKQCPLDSVLSPGTLSLYYYKQLEGINHMSLLDATSTKTGDKHPGMPKVYLENDNQASIDLIEKEEIDCTETNDNIAIHSTDKTLQTYAHLHLNHSHSDLKDLRRLSAHIRRTFLARTVPAFDLYLRQSSRTLNSWRDNSNGFVKTSTYRKVLDCARKYKSILITGDDEDILPMYFERLLHDWSNREVVNVFSNKNFIDKTFQGTLIRYVNDQRSKSKKEHLANVIAIELKETPLTMSCSKGYNKIVSWLINNDADVNECRYDGASPILLACKEGNVNVVNELLNAGANIYLDDTDGKTPLHVACQFNHNAIIQLLLDKTMDPDCVSDEGITPLMISSENGNTVVVSNLLDKFADVNFCTSSGVSAFFWHARRDTRM
ncbi:unnamed protein product [Mytilus edulis]|uniref:Uncharacterized protein n=1 Tax=Mytilus edulis TaxID=6550 RepID=A0A8S3VRD8_MYTED|nr:unnamed protein product [Mytilus edulis]